MYLIITAIIIYISYRLYQHFSPTPDINPTGKYVLISGCDTGFGNGLAIELDKQGFNVLAGVYLQDNVVTLKNKLSPNATVFHLDITKQEDIDAAYDLIKEKIKVLHALVNNAGIGASGNIDWTSMELMRKVMDVNFFGHVAMTKKFLPLLIAKRDSRVVNMCSSTGYLTFPNTSAYSASKHAFEAFSDCLRREMAPWGLRISIIEPGTLRTSMTEGYADRWQNVWDELPIDIQERWGIDFLNNVVTEGISSPFIKHADDPYKAVRAIQHAIINRNPRIRYRPGWQGRLFFILYCFPTWLLDKILAKAMCFIPAAIRNQNLK
jgi:NAD(P)-dependent dehydrogenase (short-subunit alcohol dehydrogenase family)